MLLIAAVLAFVYVVSDFGEPCDADKRQTTEQYGTPDRVTNHAAETWWYDSHGRAFGFMVTSGGSCRVSTYSWTR